ncbi:MAG: methyl-accepting chemotaxis protein [Solirubrobacterales bacterium]
MAGAAVQADDLNGFGRLVAGLGWLIANVRLRLVSILISMLMGALLAAGAGGTVIAISAVAEISSVWRAFDTGLARRLVLLSELRQHLGFGGLVQHFGDYVLTADPLLRQAVARDIAKLKEVAPAYVTAGASAEEQEAIKTVLTLAEAYERALPRVVEAVERHEPAQNIHALANINPTAALTAVDRLGAVLKAEHKASADRVEAATWSVGATVVTVMVLSGILLLALAAFFFWFTRYRIVRPLDKLGGVMGHLSRGDKAIEVPLIEKSDEIGDMARAVEIFKESMIRADHLEEQKRAADQVLLDRAQRREALTDDFGSHATRMLQEVNTAVAEVRETANALLAVAEETGRQAQSVAATAGEAAANVEAVATATEQLSASGRDISRSVSRSAGITRNAVTGIEGLSATMGALDSAAEKIGEIVTLIGEIAAQTNLLALNASIEAQRAGEAGKGFAVVANEVKVLASQTARATDEIAEQVHAIQTTTRDAVTALKSVGSTIIEADEVVATIASAVQEQNAATDSIVRNIGEAASGNREVSGAIVEVSKAAEHTGGMASSMVSVTDSLAAEAETMKAEVESFLSAVRAS